MISPTTYSRRKFLEFLAASLSRGMGAADLFHAARGGD